MEVGDQIVCDKPGARRTPLVRPIGGKVKAIYNRWAIIEVIKREGVSPIDVACKIENCIPA